MVLYERLFLFEQKLYVVKLTDNINTCYTLLIPGKFVCKHVEFRK